MKREHGSIVTGLLLIGTAIVVGWALLLVAVGVDVLAMFHVACPGSKEYDRVLRDVCSDSQKLLCLGVIPLAFMALLSLLAYLSERRKSNRLKRQLSPH
jgi:hypothetical protein